MGTPWILGDRRRWRVPGTVVALLLAGVVFSSLAPSTAEYWGFFGLLIGLATATVLMVKRSKPLTPRERGVWRVVAVAIAMFFLGVLSVGLLTELGVAVAAFSPLDFFFLGGYVLMILAVYRMARLDSGGREWVLTVSDALVGGVALAALVWGYLFDPLMALLSDATPFEATVAILYPVFDVTLVFGLLILILRRSNYHLDVRLGFFALSLTAQVFGDFIYMSRAVGQQFTAAEPAWGVNLLAVACMVMTAALVDRVPKRREVAEAPTPIWALVWPYLLVALLLVVHLQNYRALEPTASEVLLLDAVIVIGVILFLRQVYVIYRDRHHVDRKRAELVASVSHELRTPLTAMVGYLTLLDTQADEFSGEVKEEMISEATDQARHMSRLVSDLLMLARGDTSYMVLERADVDTTTLVMGVLRDTDTGDMRVEQELEPDVVVQVDPDRLKQAVGNLVTNAVRYGGRRCLLLARSSGRDLVLEVHDDGPGIPSKYQTAIWEQFERGAHRLDATTPGLGIGLSIVQAVVESHGGVVHYRESERLGGACFSLTVPECVVGTEQRPRLPVGSA